MGVDMRAWETDQGAPRTDTMILLSVDPLSRSVGMLSLPRDLWVGIPGFEYGKINTAYQLGELYQAAGGGPGVAMATVEQFLGVTVDYYFQVDFTAFERFIDEIGGVKIDVPEEIEVDPLGKGNTKVLQPGIQTLPGNVALAYARARNTINGDFDRAARQQQVIIGIRERVLSFDLLPSLIARAPVLYEEIASGIRSNLTLEQLIKLGLLAQQISPQDIHRGVIGPERVTIGWSPDGQNILKPIPDQIRQLRDEIFVVSGPVHAETSDKTLAELVLEEQARIAVLNGTYTPGLAANTSDMLLEKGFVIQTTDNASQLAETTMVIDYTGNPYTLQYLTELLHINPNRIFHSYDPNSEIDIELTLGDDWAVRGGQP
jgi:LCP family protein required for cell wall assembly